MFAAIAQPVERILGKDEVASSNLASSSKKSVIPFGMADFLLADTDLNHLTATVRWTVARSRLDGIETIILGHSRPRMQANLASSSKKDTTRLGGVFFEFVDF